MEDDILMRCVLGTLKQGITFLVKTGLEEFRSFLSCNFTAVAFNKFLKDVVEFCVGFENEVLYYIVLPLTNGVCGVPKKGVFVNDNKRINSICFLKKEEIVYSVGKCNMFSAYTNNTDYKKDGWKMSILI
uniref:DDE Tnp4 domain-containing protein n=1 Tax=Strongyloides venezuelensis TaxID=75913 RepID=A0A0K0FVX6_STRVS